MKCIIYEYNPRSQLWYATKERKVLGLTDHSIKIRKWIRAKWYPRKPLGMRFEILEAKNAHLNHP